MNFGDLIAKGSAVFLKKKLSAMQAVFDAGTAPEKAAFQASVSGDRAKLTITQQAQQAAGATTALLNPALTGLKNPSGGADIPLGGGGSVTYTGQAFYEAIARHKGVISQIGDSNTDNAAGRPAWQQALDIEFFGPSGILRGWTNYNIGANGSELNEWVASIATGNASTPVTTRKNVWAAVNAKPDVIPISLGTNDLNTALKRAGGAGGYGSEAGIRANLKTLTDFLLANTTGAIWLRMPNPFAYEDFMGITGWADANDAAEASRRLRVIYREYIGTNPRIVVFDSHKIFGDRIDDRLTQGLDPDTSLTLMSDSFHPTELGYRRIAEGMAAQAKNQTLRGTKIAIARESVYRNAVWSITTYVRNVEVSGQLATFDFNPQDYLYGEGTVNIGLTIGSSPTQLMYSTRKASLQDLGRIEDHALLGRQDSYKNMLAALAGGVKLYFPATGTIIDATTCYMSDEVSYSGKWYPRIMFPGLALEAGVCIVWVESWAKHPTASPFFDIDIDIDNSLGEYNFAPLRCFRGRRVIVRGFSCMRTGFPGTAGSADIFYVANNNGVVDGVKCGNVSMSAGLAMGIGSVDATNYPSGLNMDLRSSSTYVGFRVGNRTNFAGGKITIHLEAV